MADAARPTDSGASAPSAGRRGGAHRLADLGVRTKIVAALSVLAVATIATGAVAIQAVNSLHHEINQVITVQKQLVDNRSAVHQGQLKSRMLVAQIAAVPTAKQKADLVASLADNDTELADTIASMNRHHATDIMPAWKPFLAGFAAWQALRDDTLVPLALAGRNADYGLAVATKSQPLIDAYLEDLDQATVDLTRYGDRVAAQADATAAGSRRTIAVVLVVGLVGGVGLALLVATGIVRPLRKVKDVLGAMADGDLTQVADVHSGDEVGQMAAALNASTASLRTTVQTLSASALALSASSSELASTSDHIAASAEQTSAQAGMVASAAEQVSTNVQTVAAGTEEMGASIREIAHNAADAARVAAQAVTVAAATNETVAKLGESSNEIGNVIKVITSIAAQTNLLALNATIEAARAGEAGKGFAVVANEVKDLAQETAQATEDIARRIEAIQSDTAGAVSAIGEFSEVIARLSDYQTTIAAAVEQQTATTNEMARNVAEAASGAGDIAANVVGVASAAETTTTGVGESQRAAVDLARMSSDLQTLVGRFTF